jgi:uncharacterized membrane protein YphA (DoxX/SURF4 family)
MNTQKILFWASTGLLSLMMLSSAFNYFTSPQMEAAFQHLGFPSYFRIELGVAKILGVIALLVPITPYLLKIFAYSGFFITFVSAIIAHIASGDPLQAMLMPVIALILLIVSIFYYEKLKPKAV